jgi:hypothetical protein
LDFPWSLCRAGLLARSPRRGATDQDTVELLKWAETYWNRQTPTMLTILMGLGDALKVRPLHGAGGFEINEVTAGRRDHIRPDLDPHASFAIAPKSRALNVAIEHRMRQP